MTTNEDLLPFPGTAFQAAEIISRGVCRMLRNLGYGTLTEFRVGTGRRVDVIGLNRNSEFIVVEIKS